MCVCMQQQVNVKSGNWSPVTHAPLKQWRPWLRHRYTLNINTQIQDCWTTATTTIWHKDIHYYIHARQVISTHIYKAWPSRNNPSITCWLTLRKVMLAYVKKTDIMSSRVGLSNCCSLSWFTLNLIYRNIWVLVTNNPVNVFPPLINTSWSTVQSILMSDTNVLMSTTRENYFIQYLPAQFSLNNVHKRGIKHHHFISFSYSISRFNYTHYTKSWPLLFNIIEAMIYMHFQSFIIEFIHYITCAFYGYVFYLLFVFFWSHYLLVLLNTYFMETVSSAVSKFTLVNWF